MYYTLAQVRGSLAGATGAYTVSDVDQVAKLNWDINKAIQGLSGLSGWECLRRTVRFLSAGPVFALPQGYAGLVRVCINGRPAALRGQDFRFLQAGPGDLSRPPRGFIPVSDAGLSPVIYEPTQAFKVFAYTDAGVSVVEPSVVITGVRPDGRTARIEVPLNHYPEYDSVTGDLVPGTCEPADAALSSVVFSKIDSVVIPSTMTGYVTLYAADEADETNRYQIACYNPQIPVPMFRRYELAGVPDQMPVEILAETRIAPVPLVRDTDVVPFEAPFEPIEWMIRADWAMKSGEVNQAQNYRNQAMNWLKAHEVTDDTIQTQVVVNSVYAGSMGELSEEADNI